MAKKFSIKRGPRGLHGTASRFIALSKKTTKQN